VKRRLVRVGLLVACLFVLTAAPVLATHTHVLLTGNGKCVILAENGQENEVDLPEGVFINNPNVDVISAAGRNHPLHVLVHTGVPGDHNALAVYGSAAGNALCSAGYVGD